MPKYTVVPATTGKQLLELLAKDGWTIGRNSTHGMSVFKLIDGINIVTTIKNSSEPLPEGTLNSILSVKQTRLGKKGLLALLNKYGLE